MNKKEVAELLSVSVRLVEKYASEGRLGVVTYVRGRTGKQADFDPTAVENLKAELESVDTQLIAPNRRAAGLANLAAEEFTESLTRAVAAGVREAIGQLPARWPPAPDANHHGGTVPLTDKLTLSLVEAAQLSGLSRVHLRFAIEEKKLKARIIGRGWRVKRADLEAYIRRL
jgi:excisionase family DNA binding protein